MTVTEEMLMAYADGELGPTERQAVETAVEADPLLAERLARHRRLRGSLSAHYAPVLDEPMPERLLNAARQDNVVDLTAARAPRAWFTPAAMAACLAAGLFVGVGLPQQSDPLTARGELATALDKQLASAPGGGKVRVGLTFRADDRYCRTYSTAQHAGVACREGEDWKLRMVMAQAAGPSGGYRTAGAETPPAVLAAVEAMIDGEPLDAEAEAHAQKGGWE